MTEMLQTTGMMQNKIVITGRMASGKSAVSKFIEDMGFRVIYADNCAKEILNRREVDEVIEKTFGFCYNSPQFKREFFENEKLRDFVNDTVYTILFEEFAKITGEYIFYEIPLYFESENIAHKCGFIPTKVLYVSSNEKSRYERLKNIRHMQMGKILEREKYFLDETAALLKSDYLIENNGSLQDLKKKTEKFIYEETKKTN